MAVLSAGERGGIAWFGLDPASAGATAVALEGGAFPGSMASPALVSFLGFPGWQALHLQLPAAADPPGMAGRLLRAQRAADPHGCAVALLVSFLRQQGDGQPLARPWGALPPGGRRLSHRYRIVCQRPRQPPQVTAWCWQGSAAGWQSCGRPQSLPGFVARFLAATEAACTGRHAVRDSVCEQLRPGLRFTLELPPSGPGHEG